uniref:G_PROTEIN_RECEP_F1_2 domain-containing protein n=1 Tax=Panagrellus redivivus TaxID=6233 RepID=A0A7E4VL89_PANRE
MGFSIFTCSTGNNLDRCIPAQPRDNHWQCYGYRGLQTRTFNKQTDYTLCLVSILTVLLITADRYLSVCHTAKYLKWQSPTKTQVLIVFSWVFPAIMFGFMIYGWSLLGGDGSGNAAYEEGECFAPFLSNPYVNMGMYVAYYWTTLVAMLILYKGIHQAAKNLEKKAKAKEHRHIALLLTQRLGTQVGVSLMLQSRRRESLPSIDGDSKRNSVVQANAPTTAGGNQSDVLEGAPLNVIKQMPLTESGHVIRRHRLTDHRSSSKSKHATLRNVKSANLTTNYKANEPDRMPLDEKQFQKTRTHSSKWGRVNENFNNEYNQINVTDENGQVTTTVECLADTVQPQRSGWFAAFRKRFHLFQSSQPAEMPALRNLPQVRNMSRSSSASSSCSSSSEIRDRPPSTKRPMMAPTVTVTRENNRTKSSIESINRGDDPKAVDPFLSTLGSQRKVSTFSQFTKDTRNRVLQSIFSPIIALNRGRKQTKAEKRAHKAFRTITFIVGLFAILWSPYYVVATIYGFCKGECIPPLLYNLSYYMCYLNSSGNPFAYALANRQFRSAFIRMFHGNFKRVT